MATAGSLAVPVAIPCLWPDSTVVCIACGPSLCQEDVAFVRDRAHVIVVNDAYKLAPWADVLYAHDSRWWDHHQGVPEFHGLKFSMERQSAKWPGVQHVANTGSQGLQDEPTGLKHGHNSGYQAVGLSVHLGARRIVLLGYDMQLGEHGKEHWFGSHPKGVRKGLPLSSFVRSFSTLVIPMQERGIEVVNCTRQTALTMFPRMSLEDAL